MTTTYLGAIRSFSRNVQLYLAATALMSFTIYGGIYTTLLNLYLLRLGYGPEFIGWLHAVAALGYALFCLLAGVLGGRHGSRSMLILGLCLMVVSYALLPMGEFLPPPAQAGWLVTTHLLGYLGIASYFVNGPPFLMSATHESQRNHAFSLRIALDPAASFLGGLFGGLLPGAFARVMGAHLADPAPFRASLLLAALVLTPGVWGLLSTRSVRRQRGALVEAESRSRIPYGLIALVALVVLLRYSGRAAVKTFFNVYLDDQLQLSPAQIGALSAMGQALSIPAALAAPSLMARWGKRRTLIVGLLGMALAQLPLALVPRWGAAGASFMVFTGLFSITTATIRVFSQEAVVPSHRPAMSSGSMMAEGVIGFGMALGGGYVIVLLGYPALFCMGALLTALGALVFWTCSRAPGGELAHAAVASERSGSP